MGFSVFLAVVVSLQLLWHEQDQLPPRDREEQDPLTSPQEMSIVRNTLAS